MAKRKASSVRNLVFVSDLHGGCRLGLYPMENPIALDDGGPYLGSKVQAVLWDWWREFWDEWVPDVTRGEPYAIVVNGDSVDGCHHNSTTQISQNLADQEEIAFRLLDPLRPLCDGRLYIIRGTEAHGGKSGVDEERLAKRLSAVSRDGRHAHWELWFRLGGRALVHCMHHIGTAGSMAYETSSPQKELEQMYVESARWGEEPPNVIVRSHRHRSVETRILTAKGFATACTTAGWQLKTPFAYKVAGARITQPQIGGLVVRCGDEDVYTRHFVKHLSRSPVEVP